MSPDEGTGFGDALEESDCHDIPWAMGRCRDHGEGSPKDHHAWEEDARLEVVEGQIAGNLTNDITEGLPSAFGFSLRIPKNQDGHSPDSKHCIDDIELVPFETQLFLHPTYIRIRQI